MQENAALSCIFPFLSCEYVEIVSKNGSLCGKLYGLSYENQKSTVVDSLHPYPFSVKRTATDACHAALRYAAPVAPYMWKTCRKPAVFVENPVDTTL